MKIFESDCIFNYSWEDVSRANWRKYCAWNTQSTHVIAVDTLDRHVDANGIVRDFRSLIRRWFANNLTIACYGTSYHLQAGCSQVASLNFRFRGVLRPRSLLCRPQGEDRHHEVHEPHSE